MTKTINIADDKTRAADEYQRFAVTQYGDVHFEADVDDEFESVVAIVLDDPFFVGSTDDWKRSVKARYEAAV